jgi:spore coat protein U-like protein
MLSSWKPRLLLAAAATTAMAAASESALANSDSDILTVRVTVQEACSITGSTIDFGTYSAGQQAALDAQGAISYSNCGAGTLNISLDGGTAGNVANRAMSSGNSGSLSYQLYRNSARNQVWGSGADAQQVVLLVPDSGSVPVYGRIPGGQNVPSGTYTDTVNVTLTF